ncbi:hypothetical protein F2Q69_00013141 [Brassica cretica]|uniref:No apical meristem-associated C-terminal domain-containing protein n=1 Tax=Brassica cretica TaxID=69181 RepID=A0A8S9R516_BRACR|nr:hypothetical protein F2Q69_00013141 [Brassica cretica]
MKIVLNYLHHNFHFNAHLVPKPLTLMERQLQSEESDGNGHQRMIFCSSARESQGTDAGCEQREPTHCKQRWHRINDLVSKFCGAYEAATREKSSGQNENDVLKLAHQIFYNNHQKRFMLDHAWKELRNDQKWCALDTAKRPSSKKRKCDDGGDSSASQATENKRPRELLMKERLSKMSLLDSLTGKQEPLAEYEEALKKKLITDLMST